MWCRVPGYAHHFSSSHVVCQFRLGLALVAFPVLHFLLSLFCSAFSFFFHFLSLSMMSAHRPSDGVGVGASRLPGRSRDTRTDPLFSVSDFIREYDAVLDLPLFAAMRMNGNSGFLWDIRFQHNHGTAVGAWRRRRCLRCGRVASICCCSSSFVDIPFVLCFEEVVYEKALRLLVAAK